MPMPLFVKSVRQSPSLLLLASLVILLLAAPEAAASAFTKVLINVLFALVMLAAVPAMTGRVWHRWVAISLAVLWLAFKVWDLASPNPLLQLGGDVLFIGFCLFAVIVLLRRIVIAARVDFEVLCASPSVFLLLAMAWAVGYEMMQLFAPGSFNITSQAGEPVTMEFIYFSLTTITTLGYGDITPISSTARVWAILEAVVGQFYLAVLVARLVSLYRE